MNITAIYRTTWIVLAVLAVALSAPRGVQAQPLAQDITTEDVEREANAGNFDAAYQLLRQLAERGDAKAQGFLAFVLYEGEWGVAVDEEQAKKWMQAAYAQNDAYAHLFVGETNAPENQDALADNPSLIRSHDWKTNIAVAAQNGHPYAQHMMGDWAKEKYKYKEAIEWYRKAAEPDRDYYAVDYYLTLSLYTWPKRFRLEEIEARVSSGNAEAYAALHSAYAFGIGTRKDYRKAFQYGIISGTFGLTPSLKASKRISENVPEAERKELIIEAANLKLSWLENPDSYFNHAMNWCVVNGQTSQHCLDNAVEDHRFCEADYMMWNFENFIDFPAYKACRKDLYE